MLVRRCFPDAPLKYMPPTKHKETDIFFSHAYDVMADLVAVWTRQGIQLLGMMTEAMHTPLLADRYVALKAATYIHRGGARASTRSSPCARTGRSPTAPAFVFGERAQAARGVPRRRHGRRHRPRPLRRREAHRDRRQGARRRGREGARVLQPVPRDSWRRSREGDRADDRAPALVVRRPARGDDGEVAPAQGPRGVEEHDRRRHPDLGRRRRATRSSRSTSSRSRAARSTPTPASRS